MNYDIPGDIVKIAAIYATVLDNGLVDIRRSHRSKLDPMPSRSVDVNDQPENRLTIDQHKLLLAQAAYEWLCTYCMEELTNTKPDMDWPSFKPGTCELCKREITVFTTQEN